MDFRLNVWWLNTSTGETRRLTSAQTIQSPSCTPDGKTVLYFDSSVPAIFKVSLDGDAPVELVRGAISSPVVSPDGKFFAYGRVDGQGPTMKAFFVVQKIEGASPVQAVPAPGGVLVGNENPYLGWAPDGKGVTFLQTIGNATHLFLQPLAGGPPVQLTHYDDDPSMVTAYAWSKDGKKFALTRAQRNSRDIVMFSGIR